MRLLADALMAALGMGGGCPWVEAPPEERETLLLGAVKAAVELGVEVNAYEKTALDLARSHESVIAYPDAQVDRQRA